jgi:hypothetical protein
MPASKRFLSSLFLPLILLATAFADEPLWTPEQRMEHRDAVVVATVLSTKKISSIDQYRDLYSADLELGKILKPHDALDGSKLTVFYEYPAEAGRGRCPSWADPKDKTTATFYLRHHAYLTGKADFIIEMGSDISGAK